MPKKRQPTNNEKREAQWVKRQGKIQPKKKPSKNNLINAQFIRKKENPEWEITWIQVDDLEWAIERMMRMLHDMTGAAYQFMLQAMVYARRQRDEIVKKQSFHPAGPAELYRITTRQPHDFKVY